MVKAGGRDFSYFAVRSLFKNNYKFLATQRFIRSKLRSKKTIRLERAISSYCLGTSFLANRNVCFLKKRDVVLSLLGKVGKVAFINDGYKVLLGQHRVRLRVRRDFYLPRFFAYLLRRVLKDLFDGWYKHGGYSFLSIRDLLRIRLPVIDLKVQKKVVFLIEQKEQEIIKQEMEIKNTKTIVNRVFSVEFGFELDELTQIKERKVLPVAFWDLARMADFRLGRRFYYLKLRKAVETAKGIAKGVIADYLAKPIKLGLRVKPEFFDDDGKAFYLTAGAIRRWCFEKKLARRVSVEFFKKCSEENKAGKNDIILARCGRGTIGKVAIIKGKKDKVIFSNFTMRVSLANFNPLFAYYYFRTDLFQALIEANKRGSGNRPNIFPRQVSRLPFPDVSFLKQAKIVEKVKEGIRTMSQKRQLVRMMRREINRMLGDFWD